MTTYYMCPCPCCSVIPRFRSFLRLKPYGVELTFSHYQPVVSIMRLDILGGYANVFVRGTVLDLHIWKNRIFVM